MSDPFIASIILFAGNFAPRGWAFCQGQILSISQNTALFSLLGTTYGGNGQTTFALPDLRGRVAIQPGQGPGLSPYSLGEMAGSQNVTLTITNMPAHTHAITPGTLAGTVRAVSGKANAQGPASNAPALEATGVTATYSSAAPDVSMRAGGVVITGEGVAASAGAGQPFSIVQPYLAINYIIALEGIFPSRN